MRRARLKVAAGILLGLGLAIASVGSVWMLIRKPVPTPLLLQSPTAPSFSAAFPDAQPGPAGVASPGPVTLAEILQRVQVRNALLENCAYDLTKVGSTLSADGKRDFLNTWIDSVQKKGELFRIRQISRKADGTLEADTSYNWDGSVSRVSVSRPNPSHPAMLNRAGAVFPEVSVFYRFVYDDAMLDFDWKTFANTPTEVHAFKFPSQWLADTIASHDADLRWLPGGLAVVTAGQGRPNQYCRVVFDTTRGCIPVRYENRYGHSGVFYYQTAEATEMKQISGIWIASSVLVQSGSTAFPQVETQYQNTITHFTIGQTTDADLAMRFSPGMEINDEVAQVTYVIGTDGVFRQLSYQDEKTGRVTAVAAGATLSKAPTRQRFDEVTPPADTAR